MAKIRVMKEKLKPISKKHSKALFDTIDIYRKALSYIAKVVHTEWSYIISTSTNAEDIKQNIVEKLIHITKDNPNTKYDFDTEFPKFPSYLRRSVTMEAIGHISSHMSNSENRLNEIANQTKYKYLTPLTLNLNPNKYPVLYRNQNVKDKNKVKNIVSIKVFMDNDWVWIDVPLQKNNNTKTMSNHISYKELNPSLISKGTKLALHYPCQYEIMLNENNIINAEKELNPDFIAVGVDLGINIPAVLSAIDVFGTVHDRKFVKLSDTDQIYKLSERISKVYRNSGTQSNMKLWVRMKNCLNEYAKHLAYEIVEFAKSANASVIVMEYLNKMRVPRGFYGARKLRFKLHYWNKIKVYKYVFSMAHRAGIRISRVNPKNTSALSFTGTGMVVRSFHKETAYIPLPVFVKNTITKGLVLSFNKTKTYNADLNASYNIASKYFMRWFKNNLGLEINTNKEATLYHLQRFSESYVLFNFKADAVSKTAS